VRERAELRELGAIGVRGCDGGVVQVGRHFSRSCQ
jgi:hypothetical protein